MPRDREQEQIKAIPQAVENDDAPGVKYTCERCALPVIEIDAWGKRLRGCLGCNHWRIMDSDRWCRLPEEDIVALRRSRRGRS